MTAATLSLQITDQSRLKTNFSHVLLVFDLNSVQPLRRQTDLFIWSTDKRNEASQTFRQSS